MKEKTPSKLKSLKRILFNLKERFYHPLDDKELSLIKNTNLFMNLDKNIFDQMLKTVRLVKVAPGRLIVKEGARGEDFYIISSGKVSVFTQDVQGNKIKLNELSVGDYFGEQASAGGVLKIRNANVEAINEVTLLRLKGKFIADLLEVDQLLKEKLESVKYTEAMKIVHSSTGLYEDLEKILQQTAKPNIIELRNNEYIFKAGDSPDNAYIILQGKVKLLIPDKKTGVFSKVLLNRGHLFGELGILNNSPRAATAIAHSNLKLLVIDAAAFKHHVDESPHLRQILFTLQEVYRIPMRDTVEQYFGDSAGEGQAITNIYKLADGRLITSSKTLKENIFSMTTLNVGVDQLFQHKNGARTIELEVVNNRITGIKAYGTWEIIPELCHVLLNGEELSTKNLERFEQSGHLY